VVDTDIIVEGFEGLLCAIEQFVLLAYAYHENSPIQSVDLSATPKEGNDFLSQSTDVDPP
jgi:hypothetical protein